MLELYHNALSSCSQKVRLVLAAKGLEYQGHDIDLASGAQHDPAYVKLNPGHVVPTLVHDGRVLIESTLINEYLEDAFPDVAMLPADPGERHAVRLFVKHIDEKVHPATGILTYGVATRPMLLGRSAEEQKAAWEHIPDPARRAARKSVIEHGVEAPEMAGAIQTFVGLLDRMEATLGDRPWIGGDAFGLGDACALPYVLRLEHMALGSLFMDGRRPRVDAWLERLKALPAYGPAVGHLLPEPIVAMFRRNAEEVQGRLEELAAS